ncbi:MAG: DUF4266 domain-containing protein [Deltaproteobacteria bacterium]|nr:DUF4266 domain-containing protein [Deltaproteobacteria bacterium]
MKSKFFVVWLIVAALLIVVAASCVVVQPYEREILADPIMQFDYFDLDRQHDLKLCETREGSAGGYGGATGGCGCK